ncbi:alpha-ribazole phosphatase family protein [Rhodobium gokarnense]|uniref:Alpha-ribazole phosphatase n=1 Tax=Rhodobium gokarnense TaxID=364296 RepID=A0ABT3H6F2_9HYPH|nr:alpha-ribazole phosphatase family protein [Rhodobium gokarnense]MCW2305965.1 alpha-ribazole phosphatase [Rhodobium gokarnense]
MPLILLRHLPPDIDPGICYGRLDVPVRVDFEEEADALIPGLPEATRIVSSPLTRCRRLAERIAAARGLDLAIDERIAEIDFARWEGVSWDDVPLAELDEWAADVLGARPHGGESVAMLAARVSRFLADCDPAEPLLCVTHAGVMRAVLAATGHPHPWQAKFAYGAWITRDLPPVTAA